MHPFARTRSTCVRLLSALALGLFASLGHAIELPIQIDGNRVHTEISLAGGSLTADVTLHFADATGLTTSSLGISAELLGPLQLLALAPRLPSAVSVPGNFPVLLRIEPPLTGGLSFADAVVLELHTHNLDYVPQTPLRLFKAPLGGTFVDITESMGAGSYRVRGSAGSFSEFLILIDLRTPDLVIDDKFAALTQRLTAAGSRMALDSYSRLNRRLLAAQQAWSQRANGEAALALDNFLADVADDSGQGIANRWRASRDLHNDAGELLALARSLRFSLILY